MGLITNFMQPSDLIGKLDSTDIVKKFSDGYELGAKMKTDAEAAKKLKEAYFKEQQAKARELQYKSEIPKHADENGVFNPQSFLQGGVEKGDINERVDFLKRFTDYNKDLANINQSNASAASSNATAYSTKFKADTDRVDFINARGAQIAGALAQGGRPDDVLALIDNDVSSGVYSREDGDKIRKQFGLVAKDEPNAGLINTEAGYNAMPLADIGSVDIAAPSNPRNTENLRILSNSYVASGLRGNDLAKYAEPQKMDVDLPQEVVKSEVNRLNGQRTVGVFKKGLTPYQAANLTIQEKNANGNMQRAVNSGGGKGNGMPDSLDKQYIKLVETQQNGRNSLAQGIATYQAGNALLKKSGRDASTGVRLPYAAKIPGAQTANFRAAVDTYKSQVVPNILAHFSALRPMSNQDLQVVLNAVGALGNQNITDEEMAREIARINQSVKNVNELAAKSYDERNEILKNYGYEPIPFGGGNKQKTDTRPSKFQELVNGKKGK